MPAIAFRYWQKTYERERKEMTSSTASTVAVAMLFARFRRFVYAFYDPVFFEAFCSEAPFDKIRAAVTQTLAGGVEEISFSMKVWTSLMFIAVGFDRFRRKIGLGPKPDEKKAAA